MGDIRIPDRVEVVVCASAAEADVDAVAALKGALDVQWLVDVADQMHDVHQRLAPFRLAVCFIREDSCLRGDRGDDTAVDALVVAVLGPLQDAVFWWIVLGVCCCVVGTLVSQIVLNADVGTPPVGAIAHNKNAPLVSLHLPM